MPLPDYRRSANLRLSFQRIIAASLTTQANGEQTLSVSTVSPTGGAVSLDVPVYFDNAWRDDPERLSDPSETPVRAFIAATWIEGMMAKGGTGLVQFDVYVREGAPGDSEGDPFGVVVDDIADEVETFFTGARADGTLRAWIPIYDFRTTPLTPTDTGKCMHVLDPARQGSWGTPSTRTYEITDDGYRRVVLRFQVRGARDGIPGFVYRHP